MKVGLHPRQQSVNEREDGRGGPSRGPALEDKLVDVVAPYIHQPDRAVLRFTKEPRSRPWTASRPCPWPRPGRHREEAFALHRRLLFTVAYEMLGSTSDAEDVVQKTWLQ